MPDTKRIEREIRQCKSDPESGITVEPIDDNLCHLQGSLLASWQRTEECLSLSSWHLILK